MVLLVESGAADGAQSRARRDENQAAEREKRKHDQGYARRRVGRSGKGCEQRVNMRLRGSTVVVVVRAPAGRGAQVQVRKAQQRKKAK
jgi:hypothetical protein